MLRKEWKSLFHNKLLLVVVIAIIAIPTIYTTLFLGSMWDPYGNLDKLPVAVVNEDRPVTYKGQVLEVGKELVDNLKKEDSLCFNFVDKTTAETGLKNGTFYMAVTIPENFSRNASTLMDENPRKMILEYQTNPGTNYIASKMSETAMEKIKNSVAEEVTKTYTQTVFDQIMEVGDGMQEAADGSRELKDGVGKISDGNQTITENLNTLADSSLTFKEGSDTLQLGLKEYVQGVSTVDSGAYALKEGAVQLKEGTSELNSKVPELAEGVGQLASGAEALKDGTSRTLEGSRQLKEGSSQVDANMSVLNEGLSQLKSQTAQLPSQAEQMNQGVQTLNAGAGQMEQAMESIYAGVNKVQTGANDLYSGLSALDSKSEDLVNGLDQVENKILQALSQMMTVNPEMPDMSGVQSKLMKLGSDAEEADAQAAAAAQSADSAAAVYTGTDPGYLMDAIYKAAEEGNMEAVVALANEAAVVAQDNYEAANAANDKAVLAAEALRQSSIALSEAGNAMRQASQIAVDTDKSDMAAAGNPAELISQAFAAYKTQLQVYTQGVALAKSGSSQIAEGLNGDKTQENPGLAAGLGSVKEGVKATKAGLQTLSEGTQILADSTPVLANAIETVQAGGQQIQKQGTSVLKDGAGSLYEGLEQVDQGSSVLGAGIGTLEGKLPVLKEGAAQLTAGAGQMEDGTRTLSDGTGRLVSNNTELLNGVSQLSSGAAQISDGAGQLRDGSKELGDGINQAADGTTTLAGSLSEGAKQVKETKTNDGTIDMFASPVEANETQITTVENNGHAMAPYMMSVGLWVGCIAFSLMYPLTQYKGKLKSGFAWWLSKASVLYTIAILQALAMVFLLHVFDGFTPVEMGKTAAFACLASVAFMSVMYFFTNFIGKVGSFLMLVFMVIQLAGSVGTYPLEISGTFVPYLHDWVPFTYTVEAFRSTISGGESIQNPVIFLVGLCMVFTLLTLVEFQLRARKIKQKKPILADWLEEKGLA